MEGRRPTKENTGQLAASQMQSWGNALAGLSRVREAAKAPAGLTRRPVQPMPRDPPASRGVLTNVAFEKLSGLFSCIREGEERSPALRNRLFSRPSDSLYTILYIGGGPTEGFAVLAFLCFQ